MHAAAAPDLITFTCPSCQANLQVGAELAGQSGPCPMCGMVISAPNNPPPPQAQPQAREMGQVPSARPDQMGGGGVAQPYQAPMDYGLPSNSVPEPDSYSVPHSVPAARPPASPNRDVHADGVELDSDPDDGFGSPQLGAGAVPSYHYGDQGQGLGMAMGLAQANSYGQQAQPYGRQAQPYGQQAQPYGQGPPKGGAPAGAQSAPGLALDYSRRKRSFPWMLTVLVAVLLGATGYLLWKMDVLTIPGLDSAGPKITQPVAPPAAPQPDSEEPAAISPTTTEPPAAAPGGGEANDTDPGGSPSSPVELVEPGSPKPTVPSPLQPVAGTDPKPAPAIVDPTPAIDPNQPVEPIASGQLIAPRNAVQNFLQSSNWSERLTHIYKGEALREQISAYYSDHKDVAIRDYRLDFFHNEEHDSGANIFVFFLTLEEQEGFPILVLEKDGKHLVDWELFIEFQDRRFKQFIEEQGKTPTSFRVVIQRVTYWEPDRDQIPNVDSLICYKIDPPYPGATQYAFVSKDSAAGAKMAEDLSWETEPLAAEVKMHWENFGDGKPYLTVDELVSRNWVRQ